MLLAGGPDIRPIKARKKDNMLHKQKNEPSISIPIDLFFSIIPSYLNCSFLVFCCRGHLINIVFSKIPTKMRIAISFVVVNAENVLAERIFTFSIPG